MHNGLLMLAGAVAVAWAIRDKQRGLPRVAGAFVVSGFVTMLILSGRRQAALSAGHVPPGWLAEMTVGGDRALASRDLLQDVAGAAIWLLLWAVYVYEEPTERRGPWVLALVPVVMAVAILAAPRPGPGGASTGLPDGMGATVALVLGLYTIGVAVYWYARRKV
jgi:hypothetical protein